MLLGLLVTSLLCYHFDTSTRIKTKIYLPFIGSQQWNRSSPQENPDILSVSSSPMSRNGEAQTPVITLSDDGSSVTGLSAVSSPDEMMMKCVEAEEARYSQEQVGLAINQSQLNSMRNLIQNIILGYTK